MTKNNQTKRGYFKEKKCPLDTSGYYEFYNIREANKTNKQPKNKV